MKNNSFLFSSFRFILCGSFLVSTLLGCKEEAAKIADSASRGGSSSTNPTTSPNLSSFNSRIQKNIGSLVSFSAGKGLQIQGHLNSPQINAQATEITDVSDNTSLVFQSYKLGSGGGFEILEPNNQNLFELKYSYFSETKNFLKTASSGNTLWLLYSENNQFKIWAMDINVPSNPYILKELSFNGASVSDFQVQDGIANVLTDSALIRWDISNISSIGSPVSCTILGKALLSYSGRSFVLKSSPSQIVELNNQCQTLQTFTSNVTNPTSFLGNDQVFLVGSNSQVEAIIPQSGQLDFSITPAAGTSFTSLSFLNGVLSIENSDGQIELMDSSNGASIGHASLMLNEQKHKIIRSNNTYLVLGINNGASYLRTSVIQFFGIF